MSKDTMSFVFSEEETGQINDIRKEYEQMTEREKFVIKEALKVYFYRKQQ